MQMAVPLAECRAGILQGINKLASPLRPHCARQRCKRALRRGAGVVERDGLENRCGRKPTEGSNPSLSAINLEHN